MVGVLALSVSDQVVKIGAFIGIAAFIGLAALSLLYFAQARELKRLREWAGRAPERAQELQDRVVAEAEQAAARRVQAAPQPRPATATAAAVTAAATGKPGAVAPATAAAKPTGEPGTPQAVPAGATAAAGAATGTATPPPGDPATPTPTPGAPAPGAAASGPGSPGVPATPTPTPTPDADKTAAPSPGAPAAATATPAPPHGSPPAGVPAPSTAAARGTAGPIPSDDTGEYTVEEDAVTPPPLPPPRRPAPAPLRSNAAASRRPAPVRPAQGSGRRSGVTTGLGVLAGILVLAGVGFGATQLLGTDEDPTTPPNQPAPSANETPGSDSGGDEASTTPRDELVVHVLNGTTISGLAADLADTLRNEGFAEPITGNNADQQRTESEVLYAEGRRGDARDVAEALDIDTVAELDPTTTTNSEGADIVVIVGADKAQ